MQNHTLFAPLYFRFSLLSFSCALWKTHTLSQGCPHRAKGEKRSLSNSPLVQGKVLTAFQIHPNSPKYSFQSPHIYIYGVSTLRSEAVQIFICYILLISCFALGVLGLGLFGCWENLGKKEINLGFHFQFLSAGKPRNGNKKVNLPEFFFCFAFPFLRNQTVGDCEAFLWLRVVLCCAWVVGKR